MTTLIQSFSPAVQNIKYFTCTKGGLHHGEVLNKICIDPNCIQKQFICVICQEEYHKTHQTMPIKQFTNILIEGNTKFENTLQSITTIDKCRAEVEKEIALKKRQVLQQFQLLQNSATKYFDEITQLTRNLLHTQGPIQKIIEDILYGKEQNIQSLTSRIKEVLSVTNVKINQNFSIKQHFSQVIDNVKQKHQETILSLTLLINDLKKNIQNASSFLGSTFYFPEINNFIWSPTLKGTKINIKKNVAQQTGMQSSGQRFILVEKSLNKNTSRKCWGMKILKLGGWIGVGISLKNKIVSANFNFHYTTLGHGSYLISTNGYSWSHSQKQYNSAFKCFTFAVGDTVFIEYNPSLNKLKFRKNNSKEKKDTFQLNVSPVPVGDQYYPCANLCGTNDSVQIVQCNTPLS